MTWGNGEVTTGGNALKFYSSIRIDIRRIGSVKNGEDTVGNRTKINVVKNKLSPPFRQIEVEIIYGRGVCRAGEVLARAEESGIITKAGAWYSLGERRLGQGRENVREALLTDRALLDEIVLLVQGPVGPAAAK